MDNKHKPLRGAAKKKILVSDESLLLKLLQRVQKLKDISLPKVGYSKLLQTVAF